MRRLFVAALVPVFAVTLIAGCSSKNEKGETGPSAKEVVKEYTNTLATAPQRARDAAAMTESKTVDALNKLDKELEGNE